jgi:4-hydroxy-tetrahydrodipicolinate reductase
MATEVFHLLQADERFGVIPFALTGKEITPEVNDDGIQLIHADAITPTWWKSLRDQYPGLIVIDFTHPNAVNLNAEMYQKNKLNFVMGTTGGNRDLLAHIFDGEFDNCAVIAPNMAKQVVMFQAMMQFAAENFPNAFAGYTLEITESHQTGKKDTSGTAKAMVEYFNALGIPFGVDQIIMVRDPEKQLEMGIPENALGGHGFHTYTAKSADGNVLFQFTHNVCGRSNYAQGTRDAVLFLRKAVDSGVKGRIFSMKDVLKGNV